MIYISSLHLTFLYLLQFIFNFLEKQRQRMSTLMMCHELWAIIVVYILYKVPSVYMIFFNCYLLQLLFLATIVIYAKPSLHPIPNLYETPHLYLHTCMDSSFGLSSGFFNSFFSYNNERNNYLNEFTSSDIN